ncbi:MFS transporter [Myxococcota bacterium]|nr:MFS transporter [Myxococcota bacterium]MBU1413093.1 MFS transporter [Myxococcota bacterium]
MPEKTVNKNILLILVMVTSFFTPFIGAAVNLALPGIAGEFDLNAVAMSWIAMSYLLSSAVFLVPLGKLADIMGRKRIFLWGNLVLAVSSALGVFAPSAEVLIAFRVGQGLGSAMVFSTGMALITEVFPQRERGRAIGYSVTAVYTGLALSPVIGGVLISWAGWRSLFVVPAIIGVLAAIATHAAIPGEWAEARGEKFDLKGTLLYIPSMCLFMYGFAHLPAPAAFALTAVGLAGLVLFVRTELGTTSPVFEVRLFATNRLFALANFAALINYATTFAVTFVLSLYLQYIQGMSPREAGMVLIAQPLVMAVVASRSGKWSDRIDPRLLASAGMAVSAVGLLMLTLLRDDTPTAFLLVTLGVLGMGFGLFSSPNTNSIMGSVEKRHLGLASGTVGTMRLTGQMLSMGLATLVLHLFIGDSPVHAGNHGAFIRAADTIFIVFAALSGLGVWASWSRGRRPSGPA